MKNLSQINIFILLALFAGIMFFLSFYFSKKHKTANSFLLANRNVKILPASFSMAVSWIWAPAVFICSMQAYVNGLAGIFWFTVPNVLCFFIFAPFAVKLRSQMPEGFTFPQFILSRYANNKYAHLSCLLVFFSYQLGSIIINSLAGGLLLNSVSGINVSVAIITVSLIALCYSLVSGLKASIITDVVQMSLMICIALILVPWCLFKLNDLSILSSGLGGVSGDYRWILHPGIAFTMGIPMTCSLLSGPFCDQMFYQRALSIDPKIIVKTFIFSGLIFALIPISLSILGFIGAGMVREGLLNISDPQMIGPEVISALLPTGALYAFCFMAVAGLSSTMDSTYCAVSGLTSIDIYKTYFNKKADDKSIIKISRLSMIIIALIGTSLSLLKPKLLWIFLIYGAMGPAILFPAIFSVYTKKLTAKTFTNSVLLSFLIATPISIYANVTENTTLIVISSIIAILIGLLICSFTLIKKQ